MTKHQPYFGAVLQLDARAHVLASARFADPVQFAQYPLEGCISTGARGASPGSLRMKYGGTNTGLFVSIRKDPDGVLVPAQAQLAFSQIVLGLSVSQTAHVLGVDSKSVTRWQADEDETLRTMLAVNRDRVYSLFRAAQIWCGMLGDNRVELGRLFSQRLGDDNSVLDILSAKPIDWDKLRRAYHGIRTLLARRKRRRERRPPGLNLSTYGQIPRGIRMELALIEQHDYVPRDLREPWRRGVVGS